jgi:hypothetical protein
MGVVIETCVKYPGGRSRIRVTDIYFEHNIYILYIIYSTVTVSKCIALWSML